VDDPPITSMPHCTDTPRSSWYSSSLPNWPLLVVLTLAAALRGLQLGGSLWTDEFATYWCVSAPTMGECIHRVTLTQGMSPFYFLVVRAVLVVLPNTEAGLRLVSVLASVVSAGLMYWVAMLLFRKRSTAVLAALVFAVNDTHLYHAQEARPYAFGVMFALISLGCFLKLLDGSGKGRVVMAGYVLASALTCYCHYLLGVMLVAQNLVYAWRRWKSADRTAVAPLPWAALQAGVLLVLAPGLFQLYGVVSGHDAWQWLAMLGPRAAVEQFLGMFEWRVAGIAAAMFAVCGYRNRDACMRLLRSSQDELVALLVLWLTPFACVASISWMLGNSVFDERYMITALIPFHLAIAFLLSACGDVRSVLIRLAVFLMAYGGLVLVPNMRNYGGLCVRIPHDWRSAVGHVREQFREGDAILLRTGFVKENWVPDPPDPALLDYVKSPFLSPYWDVRTSPSSVPIRNLTYTSDERFNDYYLSTFAELAEHERVWVIGVAPPNTNYRLREDMVPFFMKRHDLRVERETSFSGVYVVLLIPNALE